MEGGEEMTKGKWYREVAEACDIIAHNGKFLARTFTEWAEDAERPKRHDFDRRRWPLHKRGCRR